VLPVARPVCLSDAMPGGSSTGTQQGQDDDVHDHDHDHDDDGTLTLAKLRVLDKGGAPRRGY
jgi:hypothetical protein